MVYLVHRWTGVAVCVLIALWLFSGIVMLFVGYPRLLPAERLGAMPQLSSASCCVPVEAALRHSPAPQAVQQLTLTHIAGRPGYRIKEGDGALRVVDAVTGAPAPPVDEALALRSAQAFVPGFPGAVVGRTHDDRWTHSGLLDAHRPLIQVQMQDPARTLLYVSSTTGEVVMDAPRRQRYWNFVGAWLHWVYMFREGSKDPSWSWLVIGLSAVGTLSALAGALAGIWRWRFRGSYRNGSRTPYREFHMRWHHLAGMVFGPVLLLWIFSGLMSMNPLGMFNPSARPDAKAMQQRMPGQLQPRIETRAALALLEGAGFGARELEWKLLGGQPYLLARDAQGASRLVREEGGAWQVHESFTAQQLEQPARALFDAGVVRSDWLRKHDAYYLRRGEASMYAGAARELPVLRLQFDDPGRTLAYLSPHSGELVLSVDRAQRLGRWLFNFLHSWDLPWMLRPAAARDAALIALSLGSLALALTGVVLGYRRLRLATGRG
nr:PepSY domain-containing protein [Acidovorax sp. D4N7]